MFTTNALDELKHSVRMHLLIMAGPTQQLCAFMIKLIDFMEDDNIERRNSEMLSLSYSVVEGLALYVQRSVDEKMSIAKSQGATLPQEVISAGDEILVAIGKVRSMADKRAAKAIVLKSVSQALRSMSIYTKAQYPQLTDASGNVL